VVGLVLLVGLIGLLGSYFHGSFAWFGVVLVVIEAAPLWWRRRFPVPVLALVVFAEVAKWALQVSNDPSGPALVFAVYAVSVYDRTRARFFVAVAAIVIICLGAIPVLVAWIGALVRTAQLQEWVWFVLLLVFQGVTLLAYVIAGPDQPRQTAPLYRDGSRAPTPPS